VAINRVEKLIINLDTSLPVICAWDTCDRPARTSHQVRTHEHRPGLDCGHVTAAGGVLGRHVIYAFCSDGHLDFWVSASGVRARELADRNQGRIAGMHSAGSKRTIL
jgi:hypothetical protein